MPVCLPRARLGLSPCALPQTSLVEPLSGAAPATPLTARKPANAYSSYRCPCRLTPVRARTSRCWRAAGADAVRDRSPAANCPARPADAAGAAGRRRERRSTRLPGRRSLSAWRPEPTRRDSQRGGGRASVCGWRPCGARSSCSRRYRWPCRWIRWIRWRRCPGCPTRWHRAGRSFGATQRMGRGFPEPMKPGSSGPRLEPPPARRRCPRTGAPDAARPRSRVAYCLRSRSTRRPRAHRRRQGQAPISARRRPCGSARRAALSPAARYAPSHGYGAYQPAPSTGRWFTGRFLPGNIPSDH